MSPLLSIITPCFQAARFLPGCLKHVCLEISQLPVEHLVIDGGSTDGSVTILERFASGCALMRYWSEPDRGQSDAMNKGIVLARSRYIGFLNVDDRYEPGTLSRVIGLIESAEAPVFFMGNCTARNLQGDFLYENKPAPLRARSVLNHKLFEFPYNPSSYFYPKEFHGQFGPYEVCDHLSMDYRFLCRIAGKVDYQYFDEYWGVFVIHDDCKTSRTIADLENRKNAVRREEMARRGFLFSIYVDTYSVIVLISRSTKGATQEGIGRMRVRLRLGHRLRSLCSAIRRIWG